MTQTVSSHDVERAVPPCPRCGYERIGIDPTRPCPECGDTPDPETRVFWGECMPRYLTTQFPWYWLILIAGFVVLLLLGFVSSVFNVVSGFGYFIILALFFAGITLWKRLSRDKRVGGSVQLRLGPNGWATRVGFGEVKWRRWPRRFRVGDSAPNQLFIETPGIGWLVVDRLLAFTFHSSAEAAEARRLVEVRCEEA